MKQTVTPKQDGRPLTDSLQLVGVEAHSSGFLLTQSIFAVACHERVFEPVFFSHSLTRLSRNTGAHRHTHRVLRFVAAAITRIRRKAAYNPRNIRFVSASSRSFLPFETALPSLSSTSFNVGISSTQGHQQAQVASVEAVHSSTRRRDNKDCRGPWCLASKQPVANSFYLPLNLFVRGNNPRFDRTNSQARVDFTCS